MCQCAFFLLFTPSPRSAWPQTPQYLRQYYLMESAFLLIRIVGLSVLALWFHKCGPGVEALLQPSRSEAEGAAIQN